MAADADRDAGPRYRGLPLQPRRKRSNPARALGILLALAAVFIVLPSVVEMPQLPQTNEAERVEWDLQRIDAGFRDYVARFPTSQFARLEGVNPMIYAGISLPRYVGEVAPGDERPEPGHWYFDQRLRHLVYRVQSTDRIRSLGPISGELHFHVSRAGLGPEIQGFEPQRGDRPQLRPRYRYRVDRAR